MAPTHLPESCTCDRATTATPRLTVTDMTTAKQTAHRARAMIAQGHQTAANDLAQAYIRMAKSDRATLLRISALNRQGLWAKGADWAAA